MREELEKVFLVVVLVIFSFVLFNYDVSYTGFIALEDPEANPDYIKDVVEYVITNSDMNGFLVDGSRICVIVRLFENFSYSFDVDKDGSALGVSLNEQYLCDGPSEEDFIFSFVSYEEFASYLDNSTDVKFKDGRGGDSYYILPSKYVEEGGNILCVDEFKQKYCPVIGDFLDVEEKILSDLTCCIGETLDAAEEILMEEHFESDRYKEEEEDTVLFDKRFGVVEEMPLVIEPEIEEPAIVESGGARIFLYVGGGLLFFLIIGGLGILLHSKVTVKPDDDHELIKLQTWMHEAHNHGLSMEQIEEQLVGQGWDKNLIDRAVENVRNPKEKL